MAQRWRSALSHGIPVRRAGVGARAAPPRRRPPRPMYAAKTAKPRTARDGARSRTCVVSNCVPGVQRQVRMTCGGPGAAAARRRAAGRTAGPNERRDRRRRCCASARPRPTPSAPSTVRKSAVPSDRAQRVRVAERVSSPCRRAIACRRRTRRTSATSISTNVDRGEDASFAHSTGSRRGHRR